LKRLSLICHRGVEMLNKEDFGKYLEQMEAIEAAMIKVYSRSVLLAKSQDLKRVFWVS